MDLKLTGKIALVTGLTVGKSGIPTQYSSRQKGPRSDWRSTDCRWHRRGQPRSYLSAGEN